MGSVESKDVEEIWIVRHCSPFYTVPSQSDDGEIGFGNVPMADLAQPFYIHLSQRQGAQRSCGVYPKVSLIARPRPNLAYSSSCIRLVIMRIQVYNKKSKPGSSFPSSTDIPLLFIFVPLRTVLPDPCRTCRTRQPHPCIIHHRRILPSCLSIRLIRYRRIKPISRDLRCRLSLSSVEIS